MVKNFPKLLYAVLVFSYVGKKIGDRIFFEPLTFTETDWMQKENKKFPYYIVFLQMRLKRGK